MAKQVKVLATKPDDLLNSSDQPAGEKELFPACFLVASTYSQRHADK